MALKKLSITEQDAEQVKELLVKGLSTYKISEITGINQPKIWRNVELMGLNRKRKTGNHNKSQYFKWNDFGNCVI